MAEEEETRCRCRLFVDIVSDAAVDTVEVAAVIVVDDDFVQLY